MRYFIVSDIHSCFSVLNKALQKAGFDKNVDTLITLGDNFDRGNESYEMFKFLSTLPNVILIRGNHEDLLEELLYKPYPQDYDFSNGTVKTLADIYEHFDKNFEKEYDVYSVHIKIKKTPFYKWFIRANWQDYIQFGNLILTHAALPNNKIKSFDMCRWEDPRKTKLKNKILICGHFFAWLGNMEVDGFLSDQEHRQIYSKEKLPVKLRNKISKPCIKENLIMIDAMTPTTLKCNVLIYDDETGNLSYNEKVICNSKEIKIKIV